MTDDWWCAKKATLCVCVCVCAVRQSGEATENTVWTKKKEMVISQKNLQKRIR